tara:strand:- start:490 stop:744 length:255 start_codon:yes stop_codon:yes gene_type:complete
MAIDTAEKRFSMMGFGLPFIKHIIPQGALGKAGRATLMDLYSGIPLEELSIINMRHTWDYTTQDIVTMKIKTAISTLKFKVDNS